jgi:tRNA (guanine-N7-)-methyltransferase
MDVTAREAPHPIRLYGRRRGRALRPGRTAAIAERLPDYALSLPPDGTPIDPYSLFAAAVADVWLEIGFGSGEHLLGRAAMHPEVGFIGCEPWIDGVAALLAKANPTLLPRLRVFPGDARPLLGKLRNNSLGSMFVLFSDPWPKRRHHRRRLIGAETLHDIARVLRPGGELLFASDHRDYVRWTLALADEEPDLAWRARRPHDWRQPPDGWVPTRYQRKAEARGVACYYLRFECRRER